MTPVSPAEKALADVCSYPSDFADWLERSKRRAVDGWRDEFRRRESGKAMDRLGKSDA